MIHYLTYYHRGHNKRNSNELKHLHEYFSWKAEVVFSTSARVLTLLMTKPTASPA